MLYTVKRLTGLDGAYRFGDTFDPKALKAPWDALEQADICDYPWLDAFPSHFEASARVGADEKGLYALMVAKEAPIQAKETRFGGMPCMDSCLEFFLMPFPDSSKKYLNVEINPAGVAHVGIGEGRYDRFVYSRKIDGLEINTYSDGVLWAVSFTLPNGLFIENYGKAPAGGERMKGNFYKCSGPELHEHYGCWNHVDTAKPDFHRPEYFADIVIE